MTPFVGMLPPPITAATLKAKLAELEQLANARSYYFLRWPDRVSGFVTAEELPTNFPSPEGQMFDTQLEARWQPYTDGFELLLLSAMGKQAGFEPVGSQWEIQQRPAYVHPARETRLPTITDARGLSLAQRYFYDARTRTVHFVALTIANQS